MDARLYIKAQTNNKKPNIAANVPGTAEVPLAAFGWNEPVHQYSSKRQRGECNLLAGVVRSNFKIIINIVKTSPYINHLQVLNKHE